MAAIGVEADAAGIPEHIRALVIRLIIARRGPLVLPSAQAAVKLVPLDPVCSIREVVAGADLRPGSTRPLAFEGVQTGRVVWLISHDLLALGNKISKQVHGKQSS